MADDLSLLLGMGRTPRSVQIWVRTEQEVSTMVSKLKGLVVSGKSVWERLGDRLSVGVKVW